MAEEPSPQTCGPHPALSGLLWNASTSKRSRSDNGRSLSRFNPHSIPLLTLIPSSITARAGPYLEINLPVYLKPPFQFHLCCSTRRQIQVRPLHPPAEFLEELSKSCDLIDLDNVIFNAGFAKSGSLGSLENRRAWSFVAMNGLRWLDTPSIPMVVSMTARRILLSYLRVVFKPTSFQ